MEKIKQTLTPEQKLEAARQGGISSVIRKGFIPWTQEESEFAYELYAIQKGKGKINFRLIEKGLNETYHEGKPVRNESSIRHIIYDKVKRQKREIILYAEDDELRIPVRALLERSFSDFSVETFENGTSLEERLQRGIEDVRAVITDNNMPGINGSEIIRNYAQQEQFKHLPFILFYGGDASVGKELVERHGAFAYLIKPFGIKNLIATVEEALKYSESRELSQ